MKPRILVLTLLMMAAGAGPLAAEEPKSAAGAPPTPANVVLPRVRFTSSVAAADLFAQLHADPMLPLLDQEIQGCPIVLRVTNSVEPTSGGKAAGTATGLLAAGTLGIIPIVTNEDYVVSYDLIVNNTLVSTHTYRRNFTRSRNLWTLDKSNNLGNEGLAWVKGTATQFLADAHNDPALAKLASEYIYYFGPAE